MAIGLASQEYSKTTGYIDVMTQILCEYKFPSSQSDSAVIKINTIPLFVKYEPQNDVDVQKEQSEEAVQEFMELSTYRFPIENYHNLHKYKFP
jgi:hypothetical protein